MSFGLCLLSLARHAVYLEIQSACVSSLTFAPPFRLGYCLLPLVGRLILNKAFVYSGVFLYYFVLFLLAFGRHIREEKE